MPLNQLLCLLIEHARIHSAPYLPSAKCVHLEREIGRDKDGGADDGQM